MGIVGFRFRHTDKGGIVLINNLIGALNIGDNERADKVYKTILASGNKDLIDKANKIFERI